MNLRSPLRLGLALAACAVVAVLGAVAAQPRQQAVAADADPARSITVSGSNQVSVAPDMARVQLGVETQGATAQEAMSKTSDIANSVYDAVGAAGIPQENIKTVSVGLYPIYGKPDGTPTVTGYRANNSIQVTVNDLSKLVWALDGAVTAGANVASGIQFGLKDDAGIRRQALADAVRNARAKADAIAAAAGTSVTAVHTVTENGAEGPIPYPVRAAPAPAAGAPSIPVDPGQLTVSASVSVRFLIG